MKRYKTLAYKARLKWFHSDDVITGSVYVTGWEHGCEATVNTLLKILEQVDTLEQAKESVKYLLEQEDE